MQVDAVDDTLSRLAQLVPAAKGVRSIEGSLSELVSDLEMTARSVGNHAIRRQESEPALLNTDCSHALATVQKLFRMDDSVADLRLCR